MSTRRSGFIASQGCNERRGCTRSLGSSAGGAASSLVVLLEAGDELPEAEVLDHLLEDLVVADIDLLDLDLGFLGDEVHLSLSFLL